MVPRRKTLSAGQKLLANHNRAWIWGRNVVTETLRACRWPVVELALSRTLEANSSEEFTRLARLTNIPVTVTDDAGLTSSAEPRIIKGARPGWSNFRISRVNNFSTVRRTVP